MHVSRLGLTDFRNYADADVALSPGVTLIVGRNGQGKTNLVEALGYLASLDSHRVSTDAALVRSGAERAIVRAAVERDGRTAILELELNPGRANRARLNRSVVPRPRDLLGVLRTVLFAPEDLAIVKGDPDGRRRFLDELLVTRTPRYAGVKADYDRVLKQRNALLKSAAARRGAPVDLSTLDAWDAHLATYGGELTAARVQLVEELTPLVASRYATILGGGVGEGAIPIVETPCERDGALSHPDPVTSLAYEAAAGGLPGAADAGDAEVYREWLLAALGERRRDEVERGVTLVGPHRDDLVLRLNGLPARGYASHGESWSLALALRLAAFDLLRADGDDPVLVLDDVFAELDAGRRIALAEAVADAEQVLVTAAVDADVPASLEGRRLRVVAGVVTDEDAAARGGADAGSAER